MFSLTVLVLVDGQLWTDESVFWQLKVKDRGGYFVVYSACFPIFLADALGKPWFFQFWQKAHDRRDGVVWDSDVPRAPPVPKGTPPLVKPVFGPSRTPLEIRLPGDCGTYWGRGHPRNGKTRQQVLDEDAPPPPYSKD